MSHHQALHQAHCLASMPTLQKACTQKHPCTAAVAHCATQAQADVIAFPERQHGTSRVAMQVLLLEIQTSRVTPDMASDAIASVAISAPAKPGAKDSSPDIQARRFKA